MVNFVTVCLRNQKNITIRQLKLKEDMSSARVVDNPQTVVGMT